jgi:hypothetical protein
MILGSLAGCGGNAPASLHGVGGEGNTALGQSGGSGSGQGATGTGTPLSFNSINSVIQGGMTQLRSLQSQPPATRDAQLAAWLKQQPNVAASGSSKPGSVWARFSDGEYWIVDETFVPAGRAAGRSAKPTRASAPNRTNLTPARRAAGRDSSLELPTANTALLLDSVPSLGPPTDDLAAMLNKKGYSVSQVEPTVDNLKTAVKNVAVLHWATHGAVVNDDAGGRTLWGALTTTPANNQTKMQYQTDLAADRLVYYTAPIIQNNAVVDVTNLAVTPLFARFYHWSFAPHGFAFINCCWSADSSFTTTLQELPDGPAGFTAGWSNAANPGKAWAAAKFIIDRLLGSNLDTPAENPPQRPFPIASVFSEAQSKGVTDASTTEYGTCTLQVSDTSSSGILAPSIEYMTVQERGQDDPTAGKPTLTLNGEFGSVEGKVVVEGTVALSVQSWSNQQIKCDLPPANESGGSGDVQVISKVGVKSNSVPLTLWHGTVTYTATDVPVAYIRTWTDTDDIYFRADVHSYREQSGGGLQNQQSIFFRAAPPSACNWKVTWTPMPPRTSISPTSGTLPYGFHSNPAPFGIGFIFEGDITPDSKAIHIGWMEFGIYTNVTAGGRSTIAVMPLDVTYKADPQPVGPDGFVRYTHPVSTTCNSDWNVPADDVTGISTPQFGDHLKWSSIPAAHAPDPDKGEDDDS